MMFCCVKQLLLSLLHSYFTAVHLETVSVNSVVHSFLAWTVLLHLSISVARAFVARLFNPTPDVNYVE